MFDKSSNDLIGLVVIRLNASELHCKLLALCRYFCHSFSFSDILFCCLLSFMHSHTQCADISYPFTVKRCTFELHIYTIFVINNKRTLFHFSAIIPFDVIVWSEILWRKIHNIFLCAIFRFHSPIFSCCLFSFHLIHVPFALAHRFCVLLLRIVFTKLLQFVRILN